jgi:hypothetical protein
MRDEKSIEKVAQYELFWKNGDFLHNIRISLIQGTTELAVYGHDKHYYFFKPMNLFCLERSLLA